MRINIVNEFLILTTMSADLMEAAESWGPFPIPPCTLNSIELASIGFPCFGRTGVVHRVCDAPCHVSALDEDGVDTGFPCQPQNLKGINLAP